MAGAQRRGVPVSKPKTTESRQKHHLDRRADRLITEGEGKADDLLTTQEVADWLGVSGQWVLLGRCENYGPPFVKPFPEVTRYRRGDVIKWLRERVRLAANEYA
jgi:hypothetical protein